MIDDIDLEKRMKEIREEIRDSKMNSEIERFDNSPFREKQTGYTNLVNIEELIVKLDSESIVSYYFNLPRGIKSFVKKAIRKAVYCAVFPVLDAQNRFNADAVNLMRSLCHVNSKDYDNLLSRISELERDNKKLKKELNDMQRKRKFALDSGIDSGGA